MTLTASMLTAFMLRDHAWRDSATTLMVVVAWGMTGFLWTVEARARRARRSPTATDRGL